MKFHVNHLHADLHADDAHEILSHIFCKIRKNYFHGGMTSNLFKRSIG